MRLRVEIKLRFFTKKPLHFRKGVKCQRPKNGPKKDLHWVSRVVLSTNNNDILFLKIYTRSYEKMLILYENA